MATERSSHISPAISGDIQKVHEGWCPWALSPADIALDISIIIQLKTQKFPQNRGGEVGWGRAAAAAKIRSSSSSSAPGKRDKCRYEVECVTDVPIGCILNR